MVDRDVETPAIEGEVDPAEDRPWYEREGGVRFECTACGACCRREGIVAMTDDDLTRIAAHLGVRRRTFKRTWLVRDGAEWVIDVPQGARCPFLDAESRCTIHEVKPKQCRAYPFWPDILASRAAWQNEAAWCEGIGRGPARLARLAGPEPAKDED